MDKNKFAAAAKRYHAQAPAGKISLQVTKPCGSQGDLSLAYTPGVGAVCQEIADQPEASWLYTNRANTVAVVSDGTAILGMGNIGPEAGMPVMEGKSVLFKQFADIDSMPLCLRIPNCDPEDPEYVAQLAQAIASLAPSVGAYNLEDIKAPQCFALQERLQQLVDIPVFHDDQDGTAIILGAGLVNALKIVGKRWQDIKVVINGAGAAAIACAKLLVEFGVGKEQIFMCDRSGLITQDRTPETTNPYKQQWAQNLPAQDLETVIKGADVFIGVSTRDLLSQTMAATMNKDAIIFAVANPIPEIMPEQAYAAGARIVGTGRSDYPNQVNNSLGFPGLFRAVLDCRASTINQQMLVAATTALASLTQEPASGRALEVLEKSCPIEAAAGVFRKPNPLAENYVIPKQFDLRVVPTVAHAVTQAAIESGVAQIKLDLTSYKKTVEDRVAVMWQ